MTTNTPYQIKRGPKLSLKHRLGPKTYQKRRENEKFRHRGILRDDLLRILAWHHSFFCGSIYWAFKLTGLYRLGQRQFYNLRTHVQHWEINKLPGAFDGFRILHLSDLHLELSAKFTGNLIEKLTPLDYDITVITGDFRNNIDQHDDRCIKRLREIRAHLNGEVFAVLGNHDYIGMTPVLEEIGIEMLLNEHAVIENEGGALILAGVDDPNIYQTDDVGRALNHAPEDAPRILLSHSPAIYEQAAQHGIDLVLAGHTHAGQICLPGGVILLRNDTSPRRMLKGRWQHDATHGYTSAGTGGCAVDVRLFCPGEIAIHQLHAPLPPR